MVKCDWPDLSKGSIMVGIGPSKKHNMTYKISDPYMTKSEIVVLIREEIAKSKE